MAPDRTVEVVVVFDSIGVHTGETVGTPPVAVSTDHERGEKVKLTKEDADRHLSSGAVILASDPRAKHVKPNPPLSGGVVRTVDAVPLEETAPAVSAGEGAARVDSLSKTQLKKLGAPALKAKAASMGITLDRTDNKTTVIDKILAEQTSAPAPVLEEGAGPGETVNPGQGDEPAQPAADTATE